MAKVNIYYDLKESVFVYESVNFKFFFSSLFYLDKFRYEKECFRQKIESKFKTLYLMPVDLGDYSDIIYYSKIEKRGFYIVKVETGEELLWLGNIILDGQIKTIKNLSD